MKWLIVNADYIKFIRWLYEKRPGLERQPYQVQMLRRMESLFGVADFYSKNLRSLGHEACDIIANIEPMQKQWAREHGARFTKGPWRLRFRRGFVPWPYRTPTEHWIKEILAAQVKQFRPDVFFCLAAERIGGEFLESIKGYYLLSVVQHAAPLTNCNFKGYDVVLSSLPNQVQWFREQGLRSELLKLGFEPAVLSRLKDQGKPLSATFVGGLSAVHSQGNKLLETLCSKSLIRVWGYGLESLPQESAVRKCYMGQAWGQEMYQVLKDSKIALNRHIDVAENCANNLRLYETTGVGTMLLTDYKDNLSELFEPGKEVACYRDANECIEKIKYYLQHDNERQTIARAGQERTLREHTYYHRMEELVDIVSKYL